MNDPSQPSAPIRPALGLGIGILAVSTASIFIRYAQAYAPSLVIASYRLGLATLFLAPLVYWRYRPELRSLRRRDLLLALLAGFFLSLHFATWITSLEFTTVASSVVLVTTTPLWVALLSPVVLKETPSRRVLVGLGLALVGGIIIGLSDVCAWRSGGLACPSFHDLVRGRAFLGDMLALTGALMAAAYLMIGRRLRVKVSLISYIFVVYGMGAVVLILLTIIARQPLLGYPPPAYLWFVLLALVPQLIGHSSYNWALRYLPAAVVSIATLGEPVGSTILAYFFLHETPTIMKIFGAILILAGIVIASRSENQ